MTFLAPRIARGGWVTQVRPARRGLQHLPGCAKLTVSKRPVIGSENTDFTPLWRDSTGSRFTRRYVFFILLVNCLHQAITKGVDMDWDRLQEKWPVMRGQLRHRWGRLTEDDLDVIAGHRETFIGRVEERYSVDSGRSAAAHRGMDAHSARGEDSDRWKGLKGSARGPAGDQTSRTDGAPGWCRLVFHSIGRRSRRDHFHLMGEDAGRFGRSARRRRGWR